MTGTEFAGYIRNSTRTNSVTFPDADIVLLANVIKDDIAKEIVKNDEDYFGIPAIRNLVASGTDITLREYSLPEDCLGMIRVQAMFNAVDWVKLEELNLAQYKKPVSEIDITNKFSNDPKNCFYDILRQSVWLYSGTIIDVTDGLELFYNAYPANIIVSDLSSDIDLSIPPTSTTFSLPRQMHELWARRVGINWKANREKPVPLTAFEQMFDRDMTRALQSLTNSNQDREILGSIPYEDGTNL